MKAKNPRAAWTLEQIALLCEMYPHHKTENIAPLLDKTSSQVYSKAGNLGLKKTQEYLSSPDAGRLQRGETIGQSHRFLKGHVPANKGKKGISYPGTEATQFKKGNKPHTWTPIGSERISKEGYLQRKMTDTGVTRKDYVNVHWLNWFAAGREIPKGYALRLKDGNKAHVEIENLELISRADLMKLNSVHTIYPKEVAQLVQLRGAIQRKINRRQKDERASNPVAASE